MAEYREDDDDDLLDGDDDDEVDQNVRSSGVDDVNFNEICRVEEDGKTKYWDEAKGWSILCYLG